ncbi:MAG: hypothetical protein KDB07_02225, partial [Planctomycetes bacterium]|nr:hypothetical protein [Planctomycetota bacterium]
MATHVFDHELALGAYQLLASIDFGFQNPFVVLFGALGADNILYIYDEYCAERLTLAQHIQNLGVARLQAQERVIGDSAAAESIAHLHQAGVRMEKSRKAVADGIDR